MKRHELEVAGLKNKVEHGQHVEKKVGEINTVTLENVEKYIL